MFIVITLCVALAVAGSYVGFLFFFLKKELLFVRNGSVRSVLPV